MRLPSTVLPGLVAALTLAGCGGSGTKTVVVTRAATTTTGGKFTGTFFGETATSAVPSNTVVSTSGTLGTVPSRVITGVIPQATIVHLTTFRSPSGNIGCVMLFGIVRCDISQRSWKPPPRPTSCSQEVDFGQGLEVGHAGKGQFVCAGDTALDPRGKPLHYGEASLEGGFACDSKFTGMTCMDLRDGHGFFISSQHYRVF